VKGQQMRAAVSAIVILLTVAATSARAQDQGPLPAFELVSPAGAKVASTSLSNEGHWLLIYVSTACGSCDRLLSALEQWRPTLPAGRILIAIRGSREVAQAYAAKHADAAGVAWYADPDQRGAQALGLQHDPALIAIDNGRIAWVVTGVLNDPSAIESIVRAWTAR
jgi:hypothetical protein